MPKIDKSYVFVCSRCSYSQDASSTTCPKCKGIMTRGRINTLRGVEGTMKESGIKYKN